MKLLKSLSIALATLSLAAPSIAAGLQPESIELLQYFQRGGGKVYVDSDLCDEYAGAMGLQLGPAVHICTAPHRGDYVEMADTVRHELWHVVQACNNGPLTTDPINAITTAAAKGWTGQGYDDPDVWHIEAEAYYVAATRDESFIKAGLDKFCFN